MFKLSRFFSLLVLILCFPSLVLYPTANIPLVDSASQENQEHIQKFRIPDNYYFSLDEIMNLLEEIVEGDLEERCCPEDLKKINQFVAFLAREGKISEDYVENQILENDIEELLDEAEEITTYNTGNKEYSIVPAMFYGNSDSILCKNFVTKGWKKTKHFVKKHKKEVIIGAIVVVVVATGCIAALAAIPVVDDQMGPSNNSMTREENTANKNNTAPDECEPINIITATKENDIARHVINENVENLKSTLNQEIKKEPETSFLGAAQYIGAKAAHEIADGIIEGLSVVPEAINKFGEICDQYFPSDVFPERNSGEIAIERTHNIINKAFGVEEPYKSIESVHDIPYHEAGVPPPTMAPIVPSQANAVNGWKTGDCFKNRTKVGNVPKWDSVRYRYWRNKAEWAKNNTGHKYTNEDILRMEAGSPPRRMKANGEWESMELHHDPARRDGGLFDFVEVWPEEHANIDPRRHVKR